LTVPAPLALERLAHDARGVQSVVGGALDEIGKAQSLAEVEPMLKIARRGLARLKIAADRSAALAEMLKRPAQEGPVALHALAERALATTATLARRGVTVERDIATVEVRGDEAFLAVAITEIVAIATKSGAKHALVRVSAGSILAESDGRVSATDADVQLARSIVEHAIGGATATWSYDPVRIELRFP